MRNVALTFGFCLAIFLTSASTTFAHVFLNDGVINVFSHIEPDDSPVVGSKAKLFFVVTDKESKFDGRNCDCAISIQRTDGTVVYSQKLFIGKGDDEATASLTYTFPVKAVYDIKITGTPKAGFDFQSFEVHRVIRVDRTVSMDESATSTTPVESRNTHFILFGLAFMAIVGLFAFEGRKEKRSKGFAKGFLVLLIAVLSLSSLVFHEVHAMNFIDGAHCGDDHQCCSAQVFNTTEQSLIPTISHSVSDYFASLSRNLYDSAFVTLVHNNSPPF
ncbi:MAG: hypothetical protein RLZZ67_536 [Candidatus Parcubacteria bacterium]|jgi:hypothetical protein